MDKKGKIIVIDGADGTGKATATASVLKLLRDRKPLGEVAFLTESFPNYHDFYGRQVRAYLAGDEADGLVLVPPEIRVDPYCAALPFAADRYRTYIERMRSQLEKGSWYLLDRYYTSNMAHMATRLDSLTQRDQFINRLGKLEIGYFGLPKPSLVIVLDLPEEIRNARVRGRHGASPRTDIHEQNLHYMAKVAEEYRRLAGKFGWTVVEGVVDGRALTKKEIAERVYDAIVRFVGY